MATQSVPVERGAPGRKRRDSRTLTLLLVGRIVGEHTDGLCRIRNISASGLMTEVCGRFSIDESVRIELRNGQSVAGCVRWVEDGKLGVEFDERIADVQQLLAEPRVTVREDGVPIVRPPRLPTDCSADIQLDGLHHRAAVVDLSQGGARLITSAPLEPEALLTLTIAGLPPVRAAVRWVGGEEAGLTLLTPFAFTTLAQWLNDPALRYNRRMVQPA